MIVNTHGCLKLYSIYLYYTLFLKTYFIYAGSPRTSFKIIIIIIISALLIALRKSKVVAWFYDF